MSPMRDQGATPAARPQLFSDMARNGWALWLPIPPSAGGSEEG